MPPQGRHSKGRLGNRIMPKARGGTLVADIWASLVCVLVTDGHVDHSCLGSLQREVPGKLNPQSAR
eukprot:4863620-Alexandrium_andersonii.AAC.1